MKRIYLYLEKNREGRGCFQAYENISLLGTWNFFNHLVFGAGYSKAFSCQLPVYADSSTVNVCICHVFAFVYGVLDEFA